MSKANELGPDPKLFMNPLAAVLSADLPIPIKTAVNDYIPDRGQEQWAEDIAQGIRQAHLISKRHLDEMLECEDVIRWIRPIEALADRLELQKEHVEKIAGLAGDDFTIIRRLSEKTSIPMELSRRLRLQSERLHSEWRNEAFLEGDDRRTMGPSEAAEELGETPAGIRQKAKTLAETGGDEFAYRNSSGWQITKKGLEELKNWKDGRKKSE